MASYGFELSERMKVPVMVRMVTRLAHSRAIVEASDEAAEENSLSYPTNPRQWVLMPGNSRVRYRQLLEDYKEMEKRAEESPFNRYTPGGDRRIGILASGIAANYVAECFPGGVPFPMLKISQYPLPKALVARLADDCDEILVVEEGQPVSERSLRGVLDRGVKVRGKLDGILPLTGELTPDNVAAGLAKLLPDMDSMLLADVPAQSEMVVPRPPALCQGCGHRDVYAALNLALESFKNPKVFGDIGCYTLGWLAPFNAIDTCVDMGASITMAKGASDAGQRPAVAVIGDSTFTHSGMTGLLDAVNENTPMTVIISDNLTTGMTGGQDSQGTGKLEDICLGLGVDPEHLHTIDSLPKKVEDMRELFAREFAYEGLSVIVSRRECIQTARRHAKVKQ